MKKTALLSIVIALSICNSAWGWGKAGHIAVGKIADANLTPEAQAAVQELLKNDLLGSNKPSGRTTLASVANWADEIKSTTHAFDKWHYHDNSVCGSNSEPCPDSACVDAQIDNQLRILTDKSASERTRNEALKWIVHLVGDIHQPLHSGENHDRGGNSIQVALQGIKTKGKATLHGVWDSNLAELAIPSITPGVPTDFTQGTTASWMEDSRQLAADIAYGKMPDFACGNPTPTKIIVLDKQYQDAAKTVIEKQISFAGIRLAHILNQAFAVEPATSMWK